MKIKTQVSISIIVFIILAVVIIFSYFSSENQLYEIQKKQQIIDNIQKTSFELYYLENDYILHGGTRTVDRWTAKYNELTGQLNQLTLTDPAQQALLNSMLDSHTDLQSTFSDLVAVTGSVQGNESISASQKVKEFAASTLTGHTQMMMSRSSELSQLVKTETLEVGQRTSLIISSSIAVLMVFVLLNYLLINRSVLRSISALEKGTERIGEGDLDTKIETGSNDEMRDLSVAITEMAANLKTVLTSKSNLEKEVAERKQAENALHESEERYRNVVEDQTEFICRFLPDYTHIFVNNAYCRYFNRKREELIGHRFRPVLHPEDREIVAQHLALLTKKQPVRDIDQRIIMPDGSTRWQRWSDRAIFGENDRVIEYQSVGRDITEKKTTEDALRQASRKLTLLSSITRHDINNQLTVLVGYLTLLKKKQPDTTQNDYFQKIATAAQHISSMIQFTREYESIGVKAPAWQDCRTLVDTAAKDAPLGKIIVKNDLPAGQEVFADPLIVKVFYNLMDNAVRYGEKITTIRFYALESGDDHIVVCEDDGDGVAVEEKEKIFKRGFGKNTGLGLALSREILDITGITIKETGEPGKGARFEMAVPKGAWK